MSLLNTDAFAMGLMFGILAYGIGWILNFATTKLLKIAGRG